MKDLPMLAQYWLLKSEPSTYHWDDLVRLKRDHWDGVRNYQARNNLKAMQVGDLAFFYHSMSEKSIVGLCRIASTTYPDPTVKPDSAEFKKQWVVVDVEPVAPAPTPVSLATMKTTPELQAMALLKQSRLSVVPVTPKEFELLLTMTGLASVLKG
jgi:predicted RNA-binding protein with PUA-like domain